MASTRTFLRTRSDPTDRIRRLREQALTEPVPWAFEVALYGGESWMATRGDVWWVARRGARTAHVLRNIGVEIGPDDLLVGRIPRREPEEGERERLARAQEFMAAQPPAGGQSGHMAPDIGDLLSLGCRGVQARIDRLSAALDPAEPEAAPKLAFYRAAREALGGLCDFAARYAEEAERLAADCADPARSGELREIAAVCRRVPAEPAQSFHEALQAAHFLLFAANVVEGCGLTSPGSIDRWLYPYLQADLEAGRLTRERAQELLDGFFITFTTYIGRGLAIGMLVGGRDAKGCDVTNELTWMALHAIDHVRLAYPSLGLRVHEGTDLELVDLALEIVAEGVSQPALFNDEVITEGLRGIGLPPEHACDYMNSTCVEITPSGRSNVWVASPYYNLPQILLDIIGEAAAGKLAPGSVEEVLAELDRRLGAQIAQGVAEQNRLRYACMAHRNFPLASCFVHDCLERGLDIDCGGATYNWIECSFVGLGTVTDSLEAVRRFILDGQELSWQGLHDMLQADFECHEPWRQRLLHEPGKYGNGDERVDGIAARIMRLAVAHAHRHRTVFGGSYEPGLFAWVMHGRLGEATGATPDGRRAGVALSPGPDPVPGRATSGPTAAVMSVTSFSHRPLLGGVAFNLRFDPRQLATPDRRAKLWSLIRTYFDRGGFQTQISVVSAETLREAQERPEQHTDVLVRVAGYSDYFVNLDPTLQAEVIARTESEL